MIWAPKQKIIIGTNVATQWWDDQLSTTLHVEPTCSTAYMWNRNSKNVLLKCIVCSTNNGIRWCTTLSCYCTPWTGDCYKCSLLTFNITVYTFNLETIKSLKANIFTWHSFHNVLHKINYIPQNDPIKIQTLCTAWPY